MLTFRSFPVKKLVDGIITRGIFENAFHDLEKRFSQGWRTSFRDAAVGSLKYTGLKRRRIHTGESHKSTFVGEATHITNLSHQLRPQDLTNTAHSKNNRIFR